MSAKRRSRARTRTAGGAPERGATDGRLRMGAKLLHDGTLAVLEGDRLVFSHEAEKSANNRRYSKFSSIDVEVALRTYGLEARDVDQVVVDGWADPRVEFAGADHPDGLRVAPYVESPGDGDLLRVREFDGFALGGRRAPYRSYTHAVSHALSAYATSPFAPEARPALALVWDGGMPPHLYAVRPDERQVLPLGAVLGLAGNVYAAFACRLEPFAGHAGGSEIDPFEHELTTPGKAMAFAGLGRADPALFGVLDDAVHAQDGSREFSYRFADTVLERIASAPDGHSSADLIATLQAYLGALLVDALRERLSALRAPPRALCFSGGCALNIAWNALLRECGLFDDVWIPPFPNDTGTALGAAVADLWAAGGGPAISWDVYSGPPVVAGGAAAGWSAAPLDVTGLARLLHETGEPVVVVHGRSELGPRALGNRSILAPATDAGMKDRLNTIKGREPYRPVSPICLQDAAPDVFDPGTPDPYMLFAHRTRKQWLDRVPAVVHVDGTARLQTLRREQNPLVWGLLDEYRRLSGIPLLCNTSANFTGCGFFPDVRSATEWGRTRFVWSDGTLYERRGEAAA